MASREDVRQQMRDDQIEYLLVQFVDIHGAPKVKMVPASHFDDVIDEGAGFAGSDAERNVVEDSQGVGTGFVNFCQMVDGKHIRSWKASGSILLRSASYGG